MNGQIERDDAAAFAESVSAKLNNIVHFDPDKELNGKLDEIKGGISDSILSDVKDEVDFLYDNYGIKYKLSCDFRGSIRVGAHNSLTTNGTVNVCGNAYFDDPMKTDPNICAYSDTEKKTSCWDFFKDDDRKRDKESGKVTIADLVAVRRGDLTLCDLAKRVADCFFKLYKDGRMPPQSKDQKDAYDYKGKIGYVEISHADTSYYLVGFSITQTAL